MPTPGGGTGEDQVTGQQGGRPRTTGRSARATEKHHVPGASLLQQLLGRCGADQAQVVRGRRASSGGDDGGADRPEAGGRTCRGKNCGHRPDQLHGALGEVLTDGEPGERATRPSSSVACQGRGARSPRPARPPSRPCRWASRTVVVRAGQAGGELGEHPPAQTAPRRRTPWRGVAGSFSPIGEHLLRVQHRGRPAGRGE